MSWLFLVTFFQILLHFFSDISSLTLMVDLTLIGSFFYLFKKRRLPKILQIWELLKFKKHQNLRVELNLNIISDVLKIIALVFSFFWLSRWYHFSFDFSFLKPTAQEIYNLDVYLFCSFLSIILGKKSIAKIFGRIQITSARQGLIHYFIAIFIGAFLLMMPFSHQPFQQLALIDAFFLSVSALTVTGLSPVDIAQVLSFEGSLILLVLIQLGGLGLVMLVVGASIAINKRASLNSVLVSQTLFDNHSIGELPKFFSRVVLITFIIELLGACLLYFLLPSSLDNRFFMALFHSVSAFCNAGFSLFTENLNNEAFGFFGTLILCLLIILGGLGFPVLIDLTQCYSHKKKIWQYLSPYSRLVILINLILLIGGSLLFFISEIFSTNSQLGFFEKISHSIFYSISSRTAGFNLIPVSDFHFSTLFILILLMIIGASPISTGGGVKTTTVGLLFATVRSVLLGHNQIKIFDRAVSHKLILRAVTILFLYCFIASLGIILLIIFESQSPFALGFEAISALSTVGLSLGITSHLSLVGKILSMFLMFFGRVGILTLIIAGIGLVKKSKIKYPEDDFFVG